MVFPRTTPSSQSGYSSLRQVRGSAGPGFRGSLLQEAEVRRHERVGRRHGIGVVDGAVLACEGDPARVLAQPVLEVGSDLARPLLEPFGLALTEQQAEGIPEVKEMLDDPPEWLEEWSGQIGADLKDGLRENPSWIAFARENGTVYHTYTVSAPDPFVAPYFSFLEERTPKPGPAEPRTWRKDEYPD